MTQQAVSSGYSTLQSKNLASEDYVPRAMPRSLGTFDLVAIFVLSIFALSSAPTSASGGQAAFFYWIIGAIAFFIPCAIVTTQLGRLFPYEGSIYNWAYKALGPFWSFFAGLCAWLPAPLVVVGLGDEFIQMIQGFQPNWFTEPWQQGLFILLVIAVTAALSAQRLKVIQTVINTFFVLDMIATAVLILAGIFWLVSGHPSATNFGQALSLKTITPATFSLYGLIMFAYIGTNNALHMAGEIKPEEQGRSIQRHLIWGPLIVFVCYLGSTIALLAVQGEKAGFVTFAMIGTVDLVFGKVIGSIVAIFFLSSIIGAAAQYNYIFSRLLLVGSIDQRLPIWFGRLSKDRTPFNAVLFQAIFAALFTILIFGAIYLVPSGKPLDLTVNVYNLSQATATLVWATSTLFFFITMISLLIKQPAIFRQAGSLPRPVLWICSIVPIAAIVVATIDTFYYSWSPNIANGQWFYLEGGLTVVVLVAATIMSMLATSEAAWQGLSQTE